MKHSLVRISRVAVIVTAGLCSVTQVPAQNAAQVKAAPATKPVPSIAPAVSGTQVERIDCKGPLKFTLTRVPERARPMVYDVALDFKGSDTANLKPGHCWRQGGWDARGSLGSQQNGQLVYRVDLGKCPFFEKLVIDAGRITDYKINAESPVSSWFDWATKAEGLQFMVEANWLGRPQSANLPAIHEVVNADGLRTRASACY